MTTTTTRRGSMHGMVNHRNNNNCGYNSAPSQWSVRWSDEVKTKVTLFVKIPRKSEADHSSDYLPLSQQTQLTRRHTVQHRHKELPSAITTRRKLVDNSAPLCWLNFMLHSVRPLPRTCYYYDSVNQREWKCMSLFRRCRRHHRPNCREGGQFVNIDQLTATFENKQITITIM